MSNLEDTVRSVVEDFMKNGVLFTALDVSNAVKQALPHARHREVRDIVRGMFVSDIETQNWGRTPITVKLSDGSTAEALLYHPLADVWDLDNKYDSQKRTATTAQPFATAQATLAQAMAAPVPAPVVPVQSAPPVSARTMWDNLFKTNPSLFPKQ